VTQVESKDVLRYAVNSTATACAATPVVMFGSWGRTTLLSTIIGAASALPSYYLTYILVAKLVDALGSTMLAPLKEWIAIGAGLAAYAVVPFAIAAEYQLAIVAAMAGTVAYTLLWHHINGMKN